MKKITFLMVFMSFVSLMAYAGGDWATSAVSLTKDGGSSYLYVSIIKDGQMALGDQTRPLMDIILELQQV